MSVLRKHKVNKTIFWLNCKNVCRVKVRWTIQGIRAHSGRGSRILYGPIESNDASQNGSRDLGRIKITSFCRFFVSSKCGSVAVEKKGAFNWDLFLIDCRISRMWGRPRKYFQIEMQISAQLSSFLFDTLPDCLYPTDHLTIGSLEICFWNT